MVLSSEEVTNSSWTSLTFGGAHSSKDQVIRLRQMEGGGLPLPRSHVKSIGGAMGGETCGIPKHKQGNRCLCHRIFCALTTELFPRGIIKPPSRNAGRKPSPSAPRHQRKASSLHNELLTVQTACLPSPGVPCDTGSHGPAYQRKREETSETGAITAL